MQKIIFGHGNCRERAAVDTAILLCFFLDGCVTKDDLEKALWRSKVNRVALFISLDFFHFKALRNYYTREK